jgi:hypothetical protein
MINALDRQILESLPLLGEEEKQSIIGVIKSFIHLKEDVSPRISIEEYNKELAEAEAEYEKGDYVSHEEMLKRIKQW